MILSVDSLVEGILPYEIDVKGLPVGAHTVNVTVTDVFGQTAVTTLDYIGII